MKVRVIPPHVYLVRGLNLLEYNAIAIVPLTNCLLLHSFVFILSFGFRNLDPNSKAGQI